MSLKDIKFDLNFNSIVGIAGFGITWLWFAFGIMDDVKDTKTGLQTTKIELVQSTKDAKKEISKIQSTQAQQSSDISAVRVTLENLSTIIGRIEQRQYNERRGDVPSTTIR